MLLVALSLWLGQHAGAVRAAEFHVDGQHPAARDDGPGSAAVPWRSLSPAMARLAPGDHLIIAAGVYRDHLRLPRRADWSTQRPTLIEGQGRVLVLASDVVRDWRRVGPDRFAIDWPQETAQVFVDGRALQQIGGRLFGAAPRSDWWPGRRAGDEHDMPVDSFFYQADRKVLLLRLALPSLDGHVVEVARRSSLLDGRNLAGLTVRNLSFRHGNASPFQRGGIVDLAGHDLWLDRIDVSEADGVGIELNGDDNRLTHSRANHNGQVGIKARGQRVLLADNDSSFNNTRGFNKWWEAGGAKFVGAGGLRASRIERHRAVGNAGDGIWLDWDNRDNVIVDGFFADNAGMGIHIEASSGGLVADNIVTGNRQRGIYLPHSSRVAVAWNLVAGNGLQGIAVIDEGRRDANARFDMRPVGNRIFGNVLAWNGGALVLPGGAAAERADNRSDGNVYIGQDAHSALRLGWQGRALDLSAWRQASGQDEQSTALVLPTLFMPARGGTGADQNWTMWLRPLQARWKPVAVRAWADSVPAGTRLRGVPGPQ